jgi:ectoine hydroxylase-related dioxygenase (phytanoyl-CoA dioxygenase family)
VPFELDRDGFALLPSLLADTELAALEDLLPTPPGSAGIRIVGNPKLAAWLTESAVASAVRSVLGPQTQAVRAILFNKSVGTNWSLNWHQDRTIAVRERIETSGFDHWTTKSATIHVEPPFHIIADMVTARIHLDFVDAANAPLLVAPGSHRLGRIKESAISQAVERCGTAVCLANRSDVWLYRTPILHASSRSRVKSSRRVLHVDFSSTHLPGELQWLGIS